MHKAVSVVFDSLLDAVCVLVAIVYVAVTEVISFCTVRVKEQQ